MKRRAIWLPWYTPRGIHTETFIMSRAVAG